VSYVTLRIIVISMETIKDLDKQAGTPPAIRPSSRRGPTGLHRTLERQLAAPAVKFEAEEDWGKEQ
jgi:hypothetical protein